MITPNPEDKDRIALKLDTFRLVVESNIELLEKDLPLKEQLNLKMKMAQDYLRELDFWEKSGDQINYDGALDRAQAVLKSLRDSINQLLDE
jgi:hypothetical protein